MAGLILLLGGLSAHAQEVCYAYDGLGRLIAAMDPQGQAAIYKYDAVGNILAINLDAANGPVDILLMDPPGGTPGTQVTLFGIGFSPIPSENQVTINGLAVTVLAASRCTLTVEIPAGAATGPVTVTTPSGSATSPGPLSIFDIDITATATAVVVGGNVQFTANITGCSDPRVIWSVNGVVGGNAVVGTITAGGLYTAPAQAPPAPGIVTVRADSVGCPGLFAEQTLTIVGEWQTLASIPTPRGALVAETLADGIHAVGGAGTWGGTGLSVAHEVYDPATDTWAARAPAPDQNMWDPASAVVNGKLYLIGGWPSGSTLTREYDPLTDTWQYRAAIPTNFTWGHAAAIVDNQIYVIGGSDGPQVLRYDPATDTWTLGLAPIPVNRTGLAAGALGNKIYVVGTGSGLQIYDPLTDTWTQGASLPVTTTAPSVAVLAGKLHVFGGSSSDPSTGGDLRTVQVYNPATDSWRLRAPMPTNRSWSAAAVHAGRAHVFGGLDRSNNAIAPNEQFSNLTETVTRTFQGPPGDFSTLIQNVDGTFVRTLKDGTRINFNSNGLQTAAVDPE